MRQVHDLRGTLGKASGEVVGGRHLPPLVRKRVDVGAVRTCDRVPTLAEVAARDDRHAIARREQVRDGGLHRRSPGRREHQDRCLGAEHLAEAAEAALEDDAEVGTAVVHDGLGHRGEHLRRHRRRPRGHQVALLRHSRLSLAQRVVGIVPASSRRW